MSPKSQHGAALDEKPLRHDDATEGLEPLHDEQATEGVAFQSGRQSLFLVSHATAVRAPDGALPAPPVDVTAAAAPAPVVDRYAVRGVIGKGGMGQVLLAYDNDIRRPVAMKLLHERYQESFDARTRFLTEVRIVGQLEHPNIAPVHDVGVDGAGRPYYTMRFIEGRHLGRVIEELQRGDREAHEHWSFERRVELFLAVCSAISFAHARGYIHRDLKPENVMVGAFGEVFVVDWGIAKLVGETSELEGGARDVELPSPAAMPGSDSRTMTGSVLGTPLYMAPEQARGEIESLDARTDVYALGVMLYELMSLVHPREGLRATTSAAAARRLIAEHVPPPADRVLHPSQRAVPRDLSFVIATAMQLDPKARYQTVNELREALIKVLEGKGPVVCAQTMTSRMLRGVIDLVNGRMRLGVYLVVTILGLAAVGVAALAASLFSLLVG